HFVKIHTRKPWKNKEILERGFGGRNLDKDNNGLYSDLYKAYCEEFKMFAAINTYKNINETNSRIKVQVGNIVDLKEISDPDNNSYALVKAIITHQANNGK
ncbi:8469_t:CDS:2, partial [Racocetra persica]